MGKRNGQRRGFTGLLAPGLSLSFCLLIAGWTTNVLPPEPPAIAEISDHARYLASDALMGRAVGTPGIELARDYIAKEFARHRLLPGGDNGSYFQAVEVTIGVGAKDMSLVLVDGARLAPGRDWVPFGFSTSGTAGGELVFAGYGITAGDYGYDDYAGASVKGKIALVLRYEPPPKDEFSPFRKHPRYSRHAALREKADNARAHGAAAMVLVDLDDAESGERELIPPRRTLGRSDADLVSVQMARGPVEKALAERGISLRALKEKIDREGKPASVPLGLEVSLDVQMQRIIARADNVVALLPGANGAAGADHIILGAHYDHIGLGHFGARDRGAEGLIHYGADDNASGVAVLLRLAHALRARPRPLPATVVFAAFTGEESGLYGSQSYVTRPPLPLRSAKAMINLDMIGRLRNDRLMVGGVDTAREFPELLSDAAADLTLETTEGVGPSDHASFYHAGVPALHFHTGLHDDYHRPTDTWEKLNIQGMEKITHFTLRVVEKIAGITGPLSFRRGPSGSDRGAKPIPTSPPPDPNR